MRLGEQDIKDFQEIQEGPGHPLFKRACKNQVTCVPTIFSNAVSGQKAQQDPSAGLLVASMIDFIWYEHSFCCNVWYGSFVFKNNPSAIPISSPHPHPKKMIGLSNVVVGYQLYFGPGLFRHSFDA